MLKFFIQQLMMESDAVEKIVKNNYDFVDNKAKAYYQTNKT